MPPNDENLTEKIHHAPVEEMPDTPAGRNRVARCPFTGRRVIATCPDGSAVSSDDLYSVLRGGDPVTLVYLDGDMEGDEPPLDETPAIPDGWQREIRCPITGRRVVASLPGQRKVTSEEIYAMLREGFP